jgi:DNA excision repair protein ERCC-5
VEWEPVVAWEAPPEYQHQQQQQQQQEARQAEVVWEMELRGQQRSRPEPAGLEAELPLEPLRPTSPPKPKANSQQPSPQASAQEEAARLGEALARASAAASAGANPETGEPFSGGLGGVSLRDEFARDVREQLRLFGIPWVQAPGEAEAQCVELERAGLVDGIISDDSDCLVFGARVVYKNIFERERYVERYDAQVIERELGLDRNRLLELALLLGSDYTEGVRGIGPVHALEVLQAFPGSPLEGLREFARWLRGEAPDPEHLPEDLRALRCPGRVTLPPGFPSETVLRAYLEPNVDSSREPFEWARPRLDDLRAYARLKFGWRDDKIDGLLLPMFRRFDQGPAQGTLDGFVAPRAQPLRSLRLQSAIDRLRGVEPAPARPKTPVNKRQKAAAKQQTEGTPSAKDSELAAAAATATKKKRKQAATSKGDAEDEKKPKRGKKKKSKDHPHGPTQPQPSLHPSLQSSAPCVPSSAV